MSTPSVFARVNHGIKMEKSGFFRDKRDAGDM
jgi:hypothetical protein